MHARADAGGLLRAKDGTEPVIDFIESLPVAHQLAVDHYIDRINELTTPERPDLPYPQSFQVESQLRELRCHSGQRHYRILYRRSRQPRRLASRLPQGYAATPSARDRDRERGAGTTSRREWKPGAESASSSRPRQTAKKPRKEWTLVICPDDLATMARGTGTRTKTAATARGGGRTVGPVGTRSIEAARRRRQNDAYRAEIERLVPYARILRIVIKRRMDLGLSQREVAERMGTRNTAISRIESGQHPTKQATLARLAEALEMRCVHGFEIDRSNATPVRELVSV